MRTAIRNTLIAVLVMSSTACISAISGARTIASKVQGQVLERGSRKPIPGAIVVGTWQESVSAIGHGQTSCVHVETATTDAQGRYQLPTWKGHEPTFISSYKPGYARSQEYYKTQQQVDWYVDLLEGFKGTREEYFNYLERALGGTSCTSAGESRKNLYRFYFAVAEEEKSLAETAEQKKAAEWSLNLAADLLVNRTKPTTTNPNGWAVNIDPNDSYKKEDFLK